jgi:hypothetical protein
MAIVVVIGVPAVTAGYAFVTEWVLGFFPEKRRPSFRPWLWLAPGFAFLVAYLIYPTISTFLLSLQNADSTQFVGVDNYTSLVSKPDFWITILNTVLWIVFFAGLVVVFGLLVAVVADRVRYETVVKTFVFLPLAVSFVAAGVIWSFMYDYSATRGTLNAGLAEEHLHADHRGHLDVGRLRDRHPLRRTEGHLRGAARGGPHGRRHRAPGLHADHPPAPGADDLGSGNDDRDHGAEDVRHRVRDDERPIRHGGDRNRLLPRQIHQP